MRGLDTPAIWPLTWCSRERRPDAATGIMGGPLAGYTRRVQRSLAEQDSFASLVDAIRDGPPRLSFFGLPGVDERANLVEFFVHHEDVRRDGRAGPSANSRPRWPTRCGTGSAWPAWCCARRPSGWNSPGTT